MGLTTSYLQFIESSIEQVFGSQTRGLRMLELGDQVIAEPGITETTGKAYFSQRGYEHVSVDINGLHGAEARDLTRPEQFGDWHQRWDILTNAGTTEHVEPFRLQYECFGVLHDCVRPGGVAIHLLPDVDERDNRGVWKNHCRIYYSAAFFEMLAAECGYEVLSNTVVNGLRCVALKKVSETPFMGDRSRFLAAIDQRDYEFSHRVKTLLVQLGVLRLLQLVGLR